MIYVTGDTHGDIDFAKLIRFSNLNPHLTKEDYLIIAGDFGAVWSEKTLEQDIKPYQDLPFTVLFVDGNHENFDILDSYHVEIWNGGKIHKIAPSVYHLMRGQVFEIEQKRIFTFGGATSIDKSLRREGISWWARELPSYEELDEALSNLKKYDNKVDYIITHSCDERTLYYHPISSLGAKFHPYLENQLLSNFEDIVDYKHWYFGHFHMDFEITDKKTLLYQDILLLD